MPNFTRQNTFSAGNPVTAAGHNQNWAGLEDLLNNIKLDDANVHNLSTAALSSSLVSQLGAGATARGKSIVAAEESRTNTAYGIMPTPDRVSGIVLPTDGLIAVAYQAMWKNGFDAHAAIFLGVNQLMVTDVGSRAPNSSAPVIQEASFTLVDNVYKSLASSARGLVATDTSEATAYGGDVATGQIVAGDVAQTGGPCFIFANAGTYDVSVQFKSSGTVTVKSRKLWVWTVGF